MEDSEEEIHVGIGAERVKADNFRTSSVHLPL